MRIDPITGKIISYEDYYCPNCYAELNDYDDYCKECDMYLGEIVPNDGGFSGYTSNERHNTNDVEQYRKDADKEFNQICCCIFLILLIISTYFALMPSTL